VALASTLKKLGTDCQHSGVDNETVTEILDRGARVVTGRD
jgi:hypothetical protein